MNVRGIQCAKKCRELFVFLKQLDADVYVLQETHSNASCEKLWSAEWGNGIFFSHCSSQSAGTMILFNRKRVMQIKQLVTDPLGRYMIASVTVHEQNFVLTTVYGPKSDCPEFFSKIRDEIEHLNVPDMVIVGDFNLVLDPNIDRSVNIQYNGKAVEEVKKMISTFQLVDLWRLYYPKEILYSWKRTFPKFTGSRIDFVLCNNCLINRCVKCEYMHGYKTDHMAISVRFNLAPHKRGPGYWKFNNLLLNDVIFVERTTELIEKLLSDMQDCTPKDLWETLKHKITVFAKE